MVTPSRSVPHSRADRSRVWPDVMADEITGELHPAEILAHQWRAAVREDMTRTVIAMALSAMAFVLLVFATVLLLSYWMDFWFSMVLMSLVLAAAASALSHRSAVTQLMKQRREVHRDTGLDVSQ